MTAGPGVVCGVLQEYSACPMLLKMHAVLTQHVCHGHGQGYGHGHGHNYDQDHGQSHSHNNSHYPVSQWISAHMANASSCAHPTGCVLNKSGLQQITL
jgi:hypothetical protein